MARDIRLLFPSVPIRVIRGSCSVCRVQRELSEKLLHSDLTEQILKGYYHVYKTLGYGFNERAYENALVLTLRKWGIEVQQQAEIKVYFEGELVGDYLADLIVGGKVLLELKAAEQLVPAHEAQLLNYLKATDIEVGLLLNFGPKAEFRRKVFANERKALRRT